jgi:hypothetical protein
MTLRRHTLSLLLAVCAAHALSAKACAPSSPSRAALLQRDAITLEPGNDEDRRLMDDPMSEVRRALFKLTKPIIVLPAEALPRTVAIGPAVQSIPGALTSFIDRREIPKLDSSLRTLATSPAIVSSTEARCDNALAVRELGLQPTGFTPYDRYLGPVRTVIADVPDRGNSIAAACSFMREAHAFRYATRDPYRADPPVVTAARHEGDCKSKALWLYDRLGDPSALYVIGKVAKGARASHAWVYWRYEARWWILDPTNRATPVAADSVPRDRYVPYYSFGKDGAFRHPATQLLLAQNSIVTPTPAVASHPTKRKTRR